MAGNTTTVNDATPPEAVSGWSIFWPLAAIVSHAMLQVSFTGYTWSGNSFQGSLWPHRSSPIICLVDGVADGYLLLRALFIRDPSDKEREPHPGRNRTLTSLALFTLGVLPQAIKLFAMRGIPVTQTIAAMYLLPSVLGLVRSLISKHPERDIQKLLGSWAGSKESGKMLKGILSVLGWCPHLAGTYAFCYGFVDRVGLSASDNIVNAADWLSLPLKLVFLLYLSQNMIFMGFNKRSPIPRYPVAVILVYTNFCSIPDLIAVPGQRLNKGRVDRWHITLQLLASLCLACYLCAGLLYYLVGWIYNWCNGSVSSEILTTVNRAEIPVACPTATTQTGEENLTWAPGSESPPNDHVEPLQQPLPVPDQTLRNTDNGDVTENTTGLGHSAIASTPSPVPEAAQNDGSQATAPSWRQWAWGCLRDSLLMVPVGLVLVYFVISLYLYPEERDEVDNVVKQQNSAEEGAVGTSGAHGDRDSQAQDANSPPRSRSQKLYRWGQSSIRAVNVVLRWILKSFLTLIWRIFLGLAFVYIHALNWAWWQATERFPTEILVNAFGLLNFSLAVLYYLVFFNGEGTSAPAWSDMFG